MLAVTSAMRIGLLVAGHLHWMGLCQAQGQEDALNSPIAMPNLGRGLSLGALYDARTDERVGGFLWPLSVLKDPRFVKEMNAKKSKYSMVYDDTYADKASLVEVGAELALKARAKAGGMGQKTSASFKLSGSAEFMEKSKTSAKQVRASVAYKLRSFQQVLDVFHPDLRNQMHSSVVGDQLATHVVAGVTYGSDCIATFTYKATSLKEKTMAKSFMQTKMKALGSSSAPFNIAGASAKTEQETEVQAKFESATFSTSTGVTVDILGDVIPFGNETLPMDVDDAIAFLKQLHLHGIGDGGVPMDLTLVPIAWLDDAAAKLKRKLDSSKIDEAMKIIVELDTSLEDLNELLEIDTDGFLAWEVSLQNEVKLLESFRANITQEMSIAIDIFRDGGDTGYLTNVFETYYASNFTAHAISTLTEKKRDEITTLKAFVRSLKEQAAVPTAEHFSDYMAPSLDQQYDEVYFLLLTGMNPSKHRATMSLVKDFTAFASSLLYQQSPTVWCKTATVKDSTSCLVNYYFGAIHFDSFCEQFCDPQYCSPAPRTCTNPTASAALSFSQADRAAWCQNPCTSILGFKGNVGPFRADNRLDLLPGKPNITGVSGASDVQSDPYRQKVQLHVAAPSGGGVNNYRVRVIWLERAETDTGSGWEQSQTTFDTMEDTAAIMVRGLTAGRKYTFSVAGVNLVGVGPFSDEYRLSNGKMVKVGFSMVTIFPETPFAVPRNNSGPTWKSFRIEARLSTVSDEKIGHLRFRSGTDSFSCEEYLDATESSVSCLIRGPRPLLQDTAYEVTATNAEGDEVLGRGNFTLEVQSGLTCYSTEPHLRLLCNATGRCVSSCSECIAVQIDSNGRLLRKNTTEVSQLKMCLTDVCPDVGGIGHQVWCPDSSAQYPCFPSSGSTADCRAMCNVLSVYDSADDVCALPCKLTLSGGLSQACINVLPGDTCSIACGHGYIIDQDGPTDFACPTNNRKEVFPAGDPALRVPTCTASCSLFTCPAGYVKKPNPGSIPGQTLEECCTETICDFGKWGPALEVDPCRTCEGQSRRRRSVSCTSCPDGYRNVVGQDDCQAGCAGISCPAGYRDKANKATLPGTSYQSCCDQVVCGASTYISGTSCVTCNGVTRRRRNAVSCTSCPWSQVDRSGSDDCVWATSIHGYTRKSADCYGGDIANTRGGRSIFMCAEYCSTFTREHCFGFSYHYSTSTCILKKYGCKQSSGSYSTAHWNFYQKIW